MLNFITPNWPAPKNVRAFTTTRQGGYSRPPFNSLNTADHVGDDLKAVAQNRQLLYQSLQLDHEPLWLTQVHGTEVVLADKFTTPVAADASYTHQPQTVCVVQTADCLPLLVCNRAGTVVAAIHAGWKGLALGVIEATIHKLFQYLGTHASPADELLVWLGPAIGPEAFEVGQDVFELFVRANDQAEAAFRATKHASYFADIFLLARQRLQHLGITHIYNDEHCTYTDEKHFFSFRRDKTITGRMASLIWLEAV